MVKYPVYIHATHGLALLSSVDNYVKAFDQLHRMNTDGSDQISRVTGIYSFLQSAELQVSVFVFLATVQVVLVCYHALYVCMNRRL